MTDCILISPVAVLSGSIDSSSIEGTGLSVADVKQILTDLGKDTMFSVHVCVCIVTLPNVAV